MIAMDDRGAFVINEGTLMIGTSHSASLSAAQDEGSSAAIASGIALGTWFVWLLLAMIIFGALYTLYNWDANKGTGHLSL